MGQHTAPKHRPARTAAEARFRLLRSLKPAFTKTQIIIGLLFVVFGFATTSAIQDNQSTLILGSTRESDLVSILDDLAQREARLRQELISLENDREVLLGGDEYAALIAAKDRAKALAQIAGTEPISGAGITIGISGKISAIIILDAIQELRDAGALSIEISNQSLNVRVVANTWFADSPNGIIVSGLDLQLPISISVIGNSSVLGPALQIPGGLIDVVQSGGGTVIIEESANISIKSVVPLATN